MRRNDIGVLSGLMVLIACGGGAGPRTGVGDVAPNTAPKPAERARGNASLILGAEVATSGASDALQAIRILRPSMLRGRTGSGNDQSGTADMVVYVDGVRLGGPQQLVSVAAMNVKEIRWLSASDATTRFGTGHPFGAILVQTK